MNYQIVLSPGANAELNSVVRWYLNIDPDLAVRFLAESNKALQRIKRMPYAFSNRIDGSRRARVKRFPYHIFYSVDQNIVTVTAIVHQRRSDDYRTGQGNKPT